LFTILGCNDWTEYASPPVEIIDPNSQMPFDSIHSTVKKICTFSDSTKELRCSCFSPDSSKLLLGSHEGVAIIFDIKSGEKLHELNGHTNPIIFVRFSPDGKFVLTIGHDNVACVWNVDNGSLLYSLNVDNFLDDSAVIFSPDSKFLLNTIDNNKAGIVTICDIKNGKTIRELKGHEQPLTSVCLSSDGKKIMTGSFDKTVRIWDVATGRELYQFVVDEYQSILASFSPNDKLSLVQGGLHSKNINIWDLNAEKHLYKLAGHWFNDFDYGMERAYFSHDSKKILTIIRPIMSARIWDMENGKTKQILDDATISLTHCSFSPDDKYVLLVGRYEIMLWEVETGKITTILNDVKYKRLMRSGAYFSNDGNLIASSNEDNVVRIWDIVSGKKLFTARTQDALVKVYFSPDNNFLLARCINSAVIWDISQVRKEITKKE
jgi:WD40 repeat protein